MALVAVRGGRKVFAKPRLRLHPRKTSIAPTAALATFLCYELLGDGRRRLLQHLRPGGW